MNHDERIELLGCADQPLLAALRWQEGVGAKHPEARATLLAMLARHGGVVDPQLLRTLLRVGKQRGQGDPQLAEELVHQVAAIDNAASLALAAALHESLGRNNEAARDFLALSERIEGEARALALLSHARLSLRLRRSMPAYRSLAGAVQRSTSQRTLAVADTLFRELAAQPEIPWRRNCRIALVGSVTLDFLLPVLRGAAFAEGIRAEFWTGGFGQYAQEILDPASGLSAFNPELVIIATGFRSLALPDESAAPEEWVRGKLAEFRPLWQACRERLKAHVIQFGFEVPPEDAYGRLSGILRGGRARLIRELNVALFEAETRTPGLSILDIDQLAARVGKRIWDDAPLWFAAKQYPGPDALATLVRGLMGVVRGVLGLTAKCVVLDLDGTLWGGVVGEDGVNHLKLGGTGIGEAFVAFQRHLLGLKRRGILLAICSKNEEADARQPFLSHPEMLLKLEDISLFVANWKAKDENLREIARTLNIGLDSLVFVDDNPVERQRVRHQVPEVKVIELPEDPARFVEALEKDFPFEALALSEEDRRRVSAYQENQQREALREASSNVADFLTGLEMTVELRPFDEANLPRIAQLINKTNQFNLTARRMSESQVKDLIAAKNAYTQAVRLKDRFGDYGLIGVLIGRISGEELTIDVWLLSCRAMGRSVEKVMAAALMRAARDLGCARIAGQFVPTPKNTPVKGLFPELGFAVAAQDGDVIRYQWQMSRGLLSFPPAIQVMDSTSSVPAAAN